MAELTRSDDELLMLLAETIDELDAPPKPLVDSVKSALTWRTVDAELATLVSDSALAGAGAVRAFAPPRLLTFSAGDTTLVVEIARERHARRVIGQIVAAAPATIEVRHPDGTIEVPADEYGRFRATPVPDGPLSIACVFHDPDREPVVTSWVA